jgi:hypothetical protein
MLLATPLTTVDSAVASLGVRAAVAAPAAMAE